MFDPPSSLIESVALLKNTHGGGNDRQDLPEVRMLDVQQFVAPPGLLLHPVPPQAPQLPGQHTSRSRASPFETTHGAGNESQDLPELRMLDSQQFVTPPRLLLHPVPPQVLQLPRQHTSRVHTIACGSVQGGKNESQDLPELRMLDTQQFVAPPGLLLHPVPPQAPQLNGQQTPPAQIPSACLFVTLVEMLLRLGCVSSIADRIWWRWRRRQMRRR